MASLVVLTFTLCGSIRKLEKTFQTKKFPLPKVIKPRHNDLDVDI